MLFTPLVAARMRKMWLAPQLDRISVRPAAGAADLGYCVAREYWGRGLSV